MKAGFGIRKEDGTGDSGLGTRRPRFSVAGSLLLFSPRIPIPEPRVPALLRIPIPVPPLPALLRIPIPEPRTPFAGIGALSVFLLATACAGVASSGRRSGTDAWQPASRYLEQHPAR